MAASWGPSQLECYVDDKATVCFETRAALLDHVLLVYRTHDPANEGEALALTSRVEDSTVSHCDILNELYALYPAALTNLISTAFWRYCPNDLSDASTVAQKCPSFSAAAHYIMSTFAVRFGDFLPSEDAALRVLVRCREIMHSYGDPLEGQALAETVDDLSRGATQEDAIVQRVEAHYIASASDSIAARATLWRAVFAADVLQLPSVDACIGDATDPASALAAFNATMRQRCARGQLTTTFVRNGLSTSEADAEARRALLGQRTQPEQPTPVVDRSAGASGRQSPYATSARRVSAPQRGSSPFRTPQTGVSSRASPQRSQSEPAQPESAEAAALRSLLERSSAALARQEQLIAEQPQTRPVPEAPVGVDFDAREAQAREIEASARAAVLAQDAAEERNRHQSEQLRAVMAALEERETELLALQAECENAGRLVLEREQRTARREEDAAAREVAIADAAERSVALSEEEVARLREAQLSLAAREAAVAAREESLEKREEALLRRERELERSLDSTNAEASRLREAGEELRRNATVMDANANALLRRSAKLESREAALWRTSTEAPLTIADAPSLQSIGAALEATRQHLRNIPPPPGGDPPRQLHER